MAFRAMGTIRCGIGRGRTGATSALALAPVFSLASLVLAIVFFWAPGAAAQEVRLSALQAWPDHELLGSPLGVGIAVGVSPFPRVGVRLGYERYGDEFEGSGSTCVGLVPPGLDCSAERRAEDADMEAFTLAVPVTVLGGDRVRLRVVPGARAGSVESVQRGLRSGRTRSADKSVYGFEFGGEVEWTPAERLPVHLHLGGQAGVLRGWEEELIADGYTPFEEDITYGRLELGVTLRR